MSISTGVAPAISMAATVATAVCETVATASPVADAEAAQGQRQRVGAVGDADGVADADVGGEFRFEGRDLLAEDVPAAVERARHRRVDLRLAGAVAGAGIGLGTAEAIDTLNQGLRIDPARSELHIALARAYRTKGSSRRPTRS